MNDAPLSRLRVADLLPVATVGLRTRRLRAALSVLGITIGIAAIVSVLGITRSSQSDLLAQIDRLGTNLLTVAGGTNLEGEEVPLPVSAAATIARTEGVQAVAATGQLRAVNVYRTDRVPVYRTNGLAARAVGSSLLTTLNIHMAQGVFFNDATARYPTVVLGHGAARQLGITAPGSDTRIYIGGRWFVVIGVLQPAELAPEIDQSVLIGIPAAREYFGYDSHPNQVYVRTDTTRTAAVASLLAPAANPLEPQTVRVSRPSDALAARLVVANSTTSLFLGLGAVALLVGAIGIANVMVISVLERRGEIGLRRAIGASRTHVAAQFLTESVLLSIFGGICGVGVGVVITQVVARYQGWQPLVPAVAMWAGLGAALAIGAIAGLYPAQRAARLSPTDALRSS